MLLLIVNQLKNISVRLGSKIASFDWVRPKKPSISTCFSLFSLLRCSRLFCQLESIILLETKTLWRNHISSFQFNQFSFDFLWKSIFSWGMRIDASKFSLHNRESRRKSKKQCILVINTPSGRYLLNSGGFLMVLGIFIFFITSMHQCVHVDIHLAEISLYTIRKCLVVYNEGLKWSF